MIIYEYTFEDGTVLRLLDIGLSITEIRKLKELHGESKLKCSMLNSSAGCGANDGGIEDNEHTI